MEATTESFVEYDLDEEDEEWLVKYNDGQERLSGEKLEFMIMKLEHICAEITDKAFVAAGASAAERNSAAASASTSHLSREDALAALKCANMRQAVNVAVYDYWVEKRKRKERPLMRRFQPPPPVTDANPYTVFRAREKIQRPQTRRKRENDVGSYEKMREMRFNMARAREILATVVTRERRKQDILMCEVKLHTLQEIPKATVEMLDAAMALSPAVSEDSSMEDAEGGDEPPRPGDEEEVGMGADQAEALTT
eukprot:jgi/Pico_ML_1/53009/g3631.t1